MDLQIQTLKHSLNHQQRCYQINDKKSCDLHDKKTHDQACTNTTTKLVPPAHSHYTLSRELQTVIVYITSDLIYSRTKIVIVLASDALLFKLLDWYYTNTQSQLKPKNDAFRFYLQPILCPIFRLFSRTSSSQILRRPYSQLKNVLILRKGESITFVTCVTVTPFIVLHVTKVDSIVAHIVISLFPILRINSADDVIMTSLK